MTKHTLDTLRKHRSFLKPALRSCRRSKRPSCPEAQSHKPLRSLLNLHEVGRVRGATAVWGLGFRVNLEPQKLSDSEPCTWQVHG